MKKSGIIMIISMAVLLFGTVFAQENTSPGSKVIEKMNFPEIKWNVPEVGKEVTRVELDNGLILYLMEDRELPLISGHALIRTGSIYDSKENQALAGITGSVMRTGGTKSYSPDSLNLRSPQRPHS